MATWKMPATRSLEELAGENVYPSLDSEISLAKFIETAVPGGSNGRITKIGNKLYESGDLTKPVRLWGNSWGFGAPWLDPVFAEEAAKKFRARGINYQRIHGPEIYLMAGGPMNGTNVPITTTRQYSQERWDEFDKYFYEFKKQGTVFSFGIMSPNLAVTMGNNTNRWDTTQDNQGTITVTVTNGKVTGAVASGTNKHNIPPYIYVNGAGGVGAQISCKLDSNGNIVNPLTIVSGGTGYTNGTHTNIAKILGGNGTLKIRMFCDDFARNEYSYTLYDLLNHVNRYTGIPYKDDESVWLVESFNESTLTHGDQVHECLFPKWQMWLYNRYGGNIDNLNTKWGSTFQSFADPALAPIPISVSPTNVATRWQKQDTMYWRTEEDVAHFKFCIKAARDAGWKGLTSALDQVEGPFASRVQALCGADIQNIHNYLSLHDNYYANTTLYSGVGAQNVPAAHNPISTTCALVHTSPHSPTIVTEYNSSLPNRYRAEAGPFGAGTASMYGVSAMVWHGDAPWSLKWGPNNRSRSKGLYPLQYGNCPPSTVGMMFGCILFMRGDFGETPVAKECVVNDRALSYHADISDVTAPFYDFRQTVGSLEMRLIPLVGRVQTTYTANNSATISSKWQTDLSLSVTAQMNEIAAQGTPTYLWHSNNTLNTNMAFERPFSAMTYEKQGRLFYDSLGGVGGLNTPCTQTAIVYSRHIRTTGSKTRMGRKFYSNTIPGTTVASSLFKTNFLDQPYWRNLEINNATDGVFVGVSSFDGRPISETNKLYVGCSGDAFNTGSMFKSAGKTIVSIPVENNGGVVFTSIPQITLTNIYNPDIDANGQNFVAVGVLSGGTTGTLTGIKVLKGGTGYPATGLIASITGQAAVVLGTPVVADDDAQEMICLQTPWANDGKEGWPILMQSVVADFNVVNINMDKPWVLHEYDFEGTKVATYPTKKITAAPGQRPGVNVLIETVKLKKPSVFFILEQVETPFRKQRM